MSTPPPAPPAEEAPPPPPPDPVIARLLELLPDPLAGDELSRDGLTLLVARERLGDVLTALRDDAQLGFGHLSDVTAVDYLDMGREPRFCVNYHLLSRPLRRRIRVRVLVDEDDPVVPTSTDVFPTAAWLEREVTDMFGIGFAGHPDPRRILLPDDFEGHPLRKDFPVGAEEIAFSHNQDRLYQGYQNPDEGHPAYAQPGPR